MPVRTVSSRSSPSPTLIWVVEGPATRTTSFLTTAASPTRFCACAGAANAVTRPAVTRPIANSEPKQLQKFISKPTDLSRHRTGSRARAMWQNYHLRGPLARRLVIAESKCVQRDGHKNLEPSHSVLPYSMMHTGVIAAVLFVLAHFAMLIGVTTPEKFYFDEVHYVPAARQMLEPVMPQPMLNPMHPPLAKQFIALSIHSFGDGPLGWRYPGVLFGSLAIVAVYLCGLALFAAQGPAIAASLLAFFNQMLFVQSRIAMLDIFALTFGLFAIAAFMHGFRRERPHLWFALAGLSCGFAIGCKWSGLFVLAVCIVIVAVIRLMQGWRTQFANASPDDWYRPDLWPDFRWWHFAICFALIPAAV